MTSKATRAASTKNPSIAKGKRTSKSASKPDSDERPTRPNGRSNGSVMYDISDKRTSNGPKGKDVRTREGHGSKGKRLLSDEGGSSKRARIDSTLGPSDDDASGTENGSPLLMTELYADESMMDFGADSEEEESELGWLSASDEEVEILRSSSPDRPLALESLRERKGIENDDLPNDHGRSPKATTASAPLASPFRLAQERKSAPSTKTRDNSRVDAPAQSACVDSPPPMGSGPLEGPIPSSTGNTAEGNKLLGLIHTYDSLAITRTLLKQRRSDLVWMKERLLNHHRNVIRVCHLAEKAMQAISRAYYVQGKGEEFIRAQGAGFVEGVEVDASRIGHL